MERLILQKTIRKNNQILNLAILKNSDISKLIQMETRSTNQFTQYYNPKKKENITMHTIKIEKSKLLTNLQVYEWRNQTQFPIVKTRFVQIIQNNQKYTSYLTLKVYIEFCPIKLNHLYDINLGQTLYLLKQSILGFERLFSRFGGFQITNSMITINQKGLCKVWLNQNFASNQQSKIKPTEVCMVERIIKLIQMHSNESKISKKIFSALKNCQKFFNTLICLQNLANSFKILVPNKFIFLTEQKQCPRSALEIINHHKAQAPPTNSFNSVRLSIRSTRPHKKNSFLNHQEHSRIKQRKNKEKSPTQIKRFKSQDKIRQASTMNVSEGQTSHSRNIKSSNIGNFFGSPRQTGYDISQLSENSTKNRKKLRKWVEQSSFIMCEEDPKIHKKQKKQLSHSEAFKPQNQFQKMHQDRKFSANYSAIKFCDPHSRFNGKKSLHHQTPRKDNTHNNDIAIQFKQILEGEDLNSNQIMTPRKSWFSDQQEQAKIKEHSQKIMQTNGWRISPDLLKSVPREMDSSFHAGEDQHHTTFKNVKLEKLGKLGRRQIIMSMLPQDAQNYC